MPERTPEKNRSSRIARLAIAFVCLLALGLGSLGGSLGVAQAAGQESATLQRVEARKVCMINNQLFAKDQIPVEVQGKTYYGCCEMCKERLAKDAAARTGTDPITGKPVDKATAVIAALEDGSVLYFESEKTFEQYAKGSKGEKK